MIMRRSRELRNPRGVAPVLAVMLVALLAAGAWAAVARPDVVFFRVGDKFAIIGWGMSSAEDELPPSVEHPEADFGGYRLWMREVWKNPDPSPESFTLVREYEFGEDNPNAPTYWPFGQYWEDEYNYCLEWDPVDPDSCLDWREGVRRDSGAFFQNAFPYEFSVSAFSASDPATVQYDQIDANRTGIVYPRVGVRNTLAEVKCIPNPYRASADWEYGGNRRVTFVGLPARATIRIYTVSADHVRTLEHNDPQSDLEFWDLKNSVGTEIAPGVYLYHVESPGLGSIESKIMIIK
jgi:hypothetical protein